LPNGFARGESLPARALGRRLARRHAAGAGRDERGEAKLQEAKGLDVEKKALKIEVSATGVKATCLCHINPD
jgi:hypothetical protein